MDKKSMGTFLTDLRKEKGLTQQEVADNLNVSNKTVSKWERDEGYPEITMLTEIAKFYEITTDELLQGGRKEREALSVETTALQNENLVFQKIKSILLVVNSVNVFSFILFFMFCSFWRWDDSIFSLYGLIGSSVISALMFLVNIIFLLKNNKDDKKQTQFTVKSFCFSLFFFIVKTFSWILFFVNSATNANIAFHFVVAAAVPLSIAVIYTVFLKLTKKYNLDDTSKENRKLRKKIVIITTLLSIVSLLTGIAFGIFSALSMQAYTTTIAFIGDESEYYTSEDGISDYMKVKNFIVGGEKLYVLVEEEDKGILVKEFDYSVQNTENGYKITYKGSEETEYIPFETYEEKAAFIDKYIIDEGRSSFFDSMDENIKFNDQSYTISYTHCINYVELLAFDCGVSICAVSMGLIPFIGLMTFIYRKKKK